MSESTVNHNTFVIERNYPVPPKRLFAAFSDPVQKRRWFAEGEHHDLEEFQLEFRVGGSELARSRFKAGTPFPGVALTAQGTYLDIVPEQRIIVAATMALGEQRISASLVTFELMPSAGGTTLLFTHQAAFFEGADGPEIREAGWRKILDRLAAILQG